MNCKKCGREIEEGTRYCPACGKAQSGTAAAKIIFKRLIIIVFLLAFSVCSFILGVQAGNSREPNSIEMPNFVKALSEKIKEIAVIPISIQYNQDELNALIKNNAPSIEPLKDIKLTFPAEGGIGISAFISKGDLKTVLGSNFPEFLLIFLSDTVPLYVNVTPQIIDGNISVQINALTVSGVSISPDIMQTLGADDMISALVHESLESQYGGSVELTELRIGTDSQTQEPVLIIGAKYYLGQ